MSIYVIGKGYRVKAYSYRVADIAVTETHTGGVYCH